MNSLRVVIICLFSLIGTGTVASSYANATGLAVVSNAVHDDAIRDQYIVMYQDVDQMRAAAEVVSTQGGTVLHRYESIAGFAAILPQRALFTVRTDPHMIAIEADMIAYQLLNDDIFTISDRSDKLNILPDGLSWGLDHIDGVIDNMYTHTTNGAGVHVYVIDSVVNEHTAFGNRVASRYDTRHDYNKMRCNNDHGTGVASVIGGENGVADGVILHSVGILSCGVKYNDSPEEAITISTVLDAIEWVETHAEFPAVVNMSVGSYQSLMYNKAVERLVAKNMIVVAAAGNVYGYDSCDVSPAGATGVITVGAVDSTNAPAWFTSMGDCVDLFAPGVHINVAQGQDQYAIRSGTSYAAPHVAGCAARFLQLHPDATPSEVLSALKAAARPVVKDVVMNTTTNLLVCDFVDENERSDAQATSFIELEGIDSIPLAIKMNDATIMLPTTHQTMSRLFIVIGLFVLFASVKSVKRKQEQPG